MFLSKGHNHSEKLVRRASCKKSIAMQDHI